MARRRLRLAYIVNQSKRKASYQKRKRGMLKKLNELTVLCDALACMIMYSSLEQGPVIWPSVERVQELIARFMSLPDVHQTRRMMSQESFKVERIEKLSTQLLKLKKDNREREMNALMHQIFSGEKTINYLNFIELNDLGWVLNINLAEIDIKVEALATTSASVVGPGTSNINVVAPAAADVFSGQSYQGMVGMQTPNRNPAGTAWSYQNDPTQGGPGPSTSQS